MDEQESFADDAEGFSPEESGDTWEDAGVPESPPDWTEVVHGDPEPEREREGEEEPDPWVDLLDQARAEAQALGFDSPEQVLAAHAQATQQAEAAALAEQQEQSWLQTVQGGLYEAYQARVDAGEMTPEVAEQLFYRDLQTAHHQHAQEQQATDLAAREVRQRVAQAVQSNPLLSVGDGFSGAILEALALSGLAPVEQIAPQFGALLQAVAEKAVADHVAKDAQNRQSAAPLLPAGGASPHHAREMPMDGGDWVHTLLSRIPWGR